MQIKETFSLRDNDTHEILRSQMSYEEAAALRDSKEPVNTHNYYQHTDYKYEILSDQYVCDNCHHPEDFPHYTCAIKYDYIRVCDYCHHQI